METRNTTHNTAGIRIPEVFGEAGPKRGPIERSGGMVTFEYRFDVLPGKLGAYEKYVAGRGKDIWLKFPGVKGVRIYKSMLGGSSPQRVVQVDLESLGALEKIFSNPGFRRTKSVFHGLVTHVSDSLLVQVSDRRK
jgi:hypothetical protein